MKPILFKFLDLSGLKILLNQLKNFFASVTTINKIEDDTKTYVTNIDYSKIAFNTKEIIYGEITSIPTDYPPVQVENDLFIHQLHDDDLQDIFFGG